MKLTCDHCKKDMGEVRDGKLRNGMVVYCKQCNDLIKRMFSNKGNDMPDFFKGLFR